MTPEMMATALIAAVTGGFGALVALIVARYSPLAPLQRTYVQTLEGRNRLLEQESEDYRLTIIRLQNEVIELRKEIEVLKTEVRRLERENLDLYRGTGLSRRDENGRYLTTKEPE